MNFDLSYKLFHNNGYFIQEINEYDVIIKDYVFSKLCIDTENGNIKIIGYSDNIIIEIYINSKIDNKYYENILIILLKLYNKKIFEDFTFSIRELNKFKKVFKSYSNKLDKKIKKD